MKQTRTFWSVVYNGIGFDSPATAWFDNKEEAVKYEERVRMTHLGFKGGF